MNALKGSDPSSFEIASLKGTGRVLAEYLWLAGSGSDALRSNTRVLNSKPLSAEELPVIVVDAGSVSHQESAGLTSCEVFLKPKKIFADPFRGGDHIIVLCDTLQTAVQGLDPYLKAGHRAACEVVMEHAQAVEPIFSVCQEFCVFPTEVEHAEACGNRKWPHDHLPNPNEPLFFFPEEPVDVAHCREASKRSPDALLKHSLGAAGREISEGLLTACLHAGLHITEVYQGSHPNAWGFKLGPLGGVDISDEVWISRFIAQGVSERRGICISFSKHAASCRPGDGGTCCFEFSTKDTRQPGIGLQAIQQHLELLNFHHFEHVRMYEQQHRPRSLHSIFNVGVGNRSCSIFVPTATMLNMAGSYIDQRPRANVDPYLVTSLLVSTCCGSAMAAQITKGIGREKENTAYPSMGSSPDDANCLFSHEKEEDRNMGSLNTEDVLIDELRRRDVKNSYYGMSLREGWDETSSCLSGC